MSPFSNCRIEWQWQMIEALYVESNETFDDKVAEVVDEPLRILRRSISLGGAVDESVILIEIQLRE